MMLKHGFSVLNIAKEQEDSMPDKLTIQNSAWFTGVSNATFSRVLNHNPSSIFSHVNACSYLVIRAMSGARQSPVIDL